MNLAIRAAGLVGASPPPSDARAVTKEVMIRELERSKSLWQRFVEWLARLFPDPPTPAIGGGWASGFPAVLGWVVVLAVIAALAWVVVRSLRGRDRRRRRSIDDDPVTESRTRTVAEWDDDATLATDAGDHRGAVRAAYRGMVAAIDSNRASSLRPGMTPSEIVDHAVELWPAVSSSIGAATDCFEQIWYAGRQAELSDVTLVRESAAVVRNAVGAPMRRRKADA